MHRAGTSPRTEGSSSPSAALLMDRKEPNPQNTASPSQGDRMKVTAPAQGQALAHLKDDAEIFLVVHMRTGCLSSHPSALLSVNLKLSLRSCLTD